MSQFYVSTEDDVRRCKEAITDRMPLVVVIPVYNEVDCIEHVLREWVTALADIDALLLIVNDGSTDGTQEVLEALAHSKPKLRILNQPNRGHGEAVMRGYREAIALAPEYIFQTDSDNQIKAASFVSMWEARERSPFILAIRKDRRDPLLRLMISRLAAMLNAVLFGVAIHDANVPFRLMETPFLARLLGEVPRHAFAPNIFLSILAARHRVTLLEIPVLHERRTTGTQSIRRLKLLKACFRTVRELMAFRLSR